VIAALVATLNPYLIWHDVHLNREILDTFLAVAVVYLTLLAAERRSWPVGAALGATLGLAILSNTRLAFLPLVLGAYLVWQTRGWRQAASVVAAAVVVCVPWAIRNDVEVGCFTLTTDTRALWKANNEHTYETLAAGKWIDDVPRIPGSPYTPEEAQTLYYRDGKLVYVDECAQMRYYRGLAFDFVEEQPGEKARLAGQAARMLWDPRSIRTEGRPGGSFLDTARTWVQPIYMIPLYAFALVGLFLLPRRVAWLIVIVLAYQTVIAMGFAGVTRYRVPWDFTLALAAAPALLALWSRVRRA
jgi:hypothetical protein